MAQAQPIAMMQIIGRSGIGAPIFLMVLLAMMVVPLPPLLLDLFFTFNIALALVVVMVAVYTMRPLEFAVFPTVLLLATLLRLALNVASTRVVLLEGHTGAGAAGKVIEAFGSFVVGGNYAVGLVVFAVLVIINFVVVTKGAGRISEVSARFTLDAMPGKQMAIDADLNAGLIDADEARARREEIAQEADFYGAMDGASKFVRGDAVAGILILFINIIGGFTVGMLQHNLGVSQAVQYYTLLTIGDGLVAQIPSLVLSTAAAIMVTRVSSRMDMSEQIVHQLASNPKPLAVTAGVIGILGLVPGMPNLVFLLIASLIGGAAYLMSQQRMDEPPSSAQLLQSEGAPPAQPAPKDLSWDDVRGVDLLSLEVGYRLIPLVDIKQGGQLMTRVKGVRKKLSQELGFLVPAVHIRDNLSLSPSAYRISIMDAMAAESEVYPDRELAINPGQVFGELQGIETRDPAFGLPGVWIEPGQREHAQTLGYTVVDASTVIATHMSHLLQTHAHELLGYEDVKRLLDKLGEVAPKLVEDLVPDTLPLSVVHKVLQNLLQEQVPIRDLRTIAECLAAHAATSQDSVALTASVRESLGRTIIQQINGLEREIPVITLNPSLEHILQQALQGEGVGAVEPGLAERMQSALREAASRQEALGQSAVLLVPGPLRYWLARLLRHAIPELRVVSYNEVPDDRQIRIVASIGGDAQGI